MIGIEVVALVAAIVNCYIGTAAYLKERKRRKLEKAQQEQKELNTLQVTIRSAKHEVQEKYDAGFRSIGPMFASGDAITRIQLLEILVNMQRNVIQTLQGSLFPNSHIVNVDYAALLELSNRSRLDSISALIQQYQRFKVAAPVTRNTLRIEASPSEAHKASRFESSRRTANDSRDSWHIAPVGGEHQKSNATGLAVNKHHRIDNAVKSCNKPWKSESSVTAAHKHYKSKGLLPSGTSKTRKIRSHGCNRYGELEISSSSTSKTRKAKMCTPALGSTDKSLKPPNRGSKSGTSRHLPYIVNENGKPQSSSNRDRTRRKRTEHIPIVNKTSKHEEVRGPAIKARKPSESSPIVSKSANLRDCYNSTSRNGNHWELAGTKRSDTAREGSYSTSKARKPTFDPVNIDGSIKSKKGAHSETSGSGVNRSRGSRTAERRSSR